MLNDRPPAVDDKPIFVAPTSNDGTAVEPAGNNNGPVIVSPVLETLPLIWVCTDEVVPDKNPNSVAVVALEVNCLFESVATALLAVKPAIIKLPSV